MLARDGAYLRLLTAAFLQWGTCGGNPVHDHAALQPLKAVFKKNAVMLTTDARQGRGVQRRLQGYKTVKGSLHQAPGARCRTGRVVISGLTSKMDGYKYMGWFDEKGTMHGKLYYKMEWSGVHKAQKDQYLFWVPYSRTWAVGPNLGTTPYNMAVADPAADPTMIKHVWRVFMGPKSFMEAALGGGKITPRPEIIAKCAKAITGAPTSSPSPSPTPWPTPPVTLAPTSYPSPWPTPAPPTAAPSPFPTPFPTPPTIAPTRTPTGAPTPAPTPCDHIVLSGLRPSHPAFPCMGTYLQNHRRTFDGKPTFRLVNRARHTSRFLYFVNGYWAIGKKLGSQDFSDIEMAVMTNARRPDLIMWDSWSYIHNGVTNATSEVHSSCAHGYVPTPYPTPSPTPKAASAAVYGELLLLGSSMASFDDDQRTAFRSGIAAALDMNPRAVELQGLVPGVMRNSIVVRFAIMTRDAFGASSSADAGNSAARATLLVMKAQSFHATLVHSLEQAHLKGASDSTVAWYTAPSLGGLPGLRAAFRPHALPPTRAPTPRAHTVDNSGLAGLVGVALAVLVLLVVRQGRSTSLVAGYSDIGSEPIRASAEASAQEESKTQEAEHELNVSLPGSSSGGRRWTERRYRAFEARRLEGIALGDNDVI